jgi:hypothetical protein
LSNLPDYQEEAACLSLSFYKWTNYFLEPIKFILSNHRQYKVEMLIYITTSQDTDLLDCDIVILGKGTQVRALIFPHPIVLPSPVVQDVSSQKVFRRERPPHYQH